MSDPLSLWNKTPTRQAILDFVVAVTDESASSYVPPAERIVAFDNDGILWCDKQVNIELHIGRKPILAAGTAGGDIHMLRYSQTSPYRSLQLLLPHDDNECEYAYDAGAEKAQQLAAVRGWQVFSMQGDFLQGFPLN